MKNIFLPVFACVLILASCAPQSTQEPSVIISIPAECDEITAGETIPLGITGSSFLSDSSKLRVSWDSLTPGAILVNGRYTALYTAPLDVDKPFDERIIVTLDFGKNKFANAPLDCKILPLEQTADGVTTAPDGVGFSFSSELIASITDLYGGPGLKYDIVVSGVRQKTHIEIIGKTASSYWLYVKINDNDTPKFGWLYQSWVKITGLNLDDVPVSSNISNIKMPSLVNKDIDKEEAEKITPISHTDSSGKDDVPVNESPVTEAPVNESPVTEAPVNESSVNETPVNESPVAESATAAPVAESATAAPIEEPAVTAAPVEEPAVTAAPVEEPAVTAAPVEEPAATAAPVEEPAATAAPVVP